MASPSPEGPPAEDEFDEQAIAQFLGFSSFGAQEQNRPSKKRRFNSHADDAVVAGGASRPAGLPPKPPAPTASGANSLPLHARVVPSASSSNAPTKEKQPQAAPGNSDEINLSDTDDNLAPSKPLTSPHGTSTGTAVAAKPPTGAPNTLLSTSSNSQWYDNYYDRNSNENPWERLEKARGINPIGPWPSSQSNGLITAQTSKIG
ncbi:hypothetical protein B0T16DRAFT_387050 [Cercophora newfieldiana]|uniref:Uncharacterized protein n=1 Tax=Cercophora newfieldiana TaxID=92897 RepID=A0AA39YFX5_9PEZI|nr:hypothetical protein B0T16DRAFT_387050 [Cercophora newfieldiana]